MIQSRVCFNWTKTGVFNRTWIQFVPDQSSFGPSKQIKLNHKRARIRFKRVLWMHPQELNQDLKEPKPSQNKWFFHCSDTDVLKSVSADESSLDSSQSLFLKQYFDRGFCSWPLWVSATGLSGLISQSFTYQNSRTESLSVWAPKNVLQKWYKNGQVELNEQIKIIWDDLYV